MIGQRLIIRQRSWSVDDIEDDLQQSGTVVEGSRKNERIHM